MQGAAQNRVANHCLNVTCFVFCVFYANLVPRGIMLLLVAASGRMPKQAGKGR